jgi:IclR family acetate operon transcriptional repressor
MDSSVLARGFLIIEVLSTSERPLTITEVARRSGMPKSTAHRLISQLIEHRIVSRSGTKITLGLRIFEWSHKSSYLRELQIKSKPHLQKLNQYLGETVSLGVLDSNEIVVVAREESSGAANEIRIGARLPAHATALGKALLSFQGTLANNSTVAVLTTYTPYTVKTLNDLDAQARLVKKHMYAVDDQEYSVGTSCVAVPLLDPLGLAYGAISVSLNSLNFNGPAMGAILKKVAADIQKEMSHCEARIARRTN